MRYLAAVFIFLSMGGCAANLSQQSLSRPPLHPLLDTQKWLPKVDRPTVKFRPYVKPTTKHGHLRIKLNLKQLPQNKYRTLEHELNFIRSAFNGTAARERLGRVYSVAQLKATGAPVARKFQVGDVLFFKQKTAPRVAIVKRVGRYGTIHAEALTRGHKRTIQINLTHRSKRRYRDHIVNSFIKRKDPGDSAGSLYLSGQLVVAARRYLDD